MRAFFWAGAVAVVFTAAQPALAQAPRPAAAFWKTVQAMCDVTAAKPASETGRRIAQTAIGEFNSFGGHQIDSTGRLFRFGRTEADQDEDGSGRESRVGGLGWWQVMKYWRSLFGDDYPSKLEVLGYRDASTATQDQQATEILRSDAAKMLKAADAATDPVEREILRESALRIAAIDTPWSAAFVSYIVKQAGVGADAFAFSNAHRAYIYDAFAASIADANATSDGKLYRACPVTTTTPREGDLLCFQREPTLADASDEAVRERIRTEIETKSETRSVRRTHCDVVASIDAPARKMYVIGGNILQSITAKKLNLRRTSRSHGLTFSMAQKSNCPGGGFWTLPGPAGAPANAGKCSLTDRKWFVLLQMR